MPTDLPPKPTREQLVELCRREPEKAADLILPLWGKVERRRCLAAGDDLEDWLEGHGQWEGLRSVAAVELECEEGGRRTTSLR